MHIHKDTNIYAACKMPLLKSLENPAVAPAKAEQIM